MFATSDRTVVVMTHNISGSDVFSFRMLHILRKSCYRTQYVPLQVKQDFLFLLLRMAAACCNYEVHCLAFAGAARVKLPEYKRVALISHFASPKEPFVFGSIAIRFKAN